MRASGNSAALKTNETIGEDSAVFVPLPTLQGLCLHHTTYRLLLIYTLSLTHPPQLSLWPTAKVTYLVKWKAMAVSSSAA
jgi:hypothetical protein